MYKGSSVYCVFDINEKDNRDCLLGVYTSESLALQEAIGLLENNANVEKKENGTWILTDTEDEDEQVHIYEFLTDMMY